MHPAIAASATKPTTTPAAIPAVFGCDEGAAEGEWVLELELTGALLAVTTTVCPACVTTEAEGDPVVDEGFAVDLATVEEEVSDEAAAAFGTS